MLPPLCDDDGGVAPTFANVQRVFDRRCTQCHCCDAYLQLGDGVSFGNLLQRPASTNDNSVDESCGGVLVVPGDAGVSYLYQKISSQPCAGQRMPRGEFGSVPIPDCEQELVRRWIAAGAPD